VTAQTVDVNGFTTSIYGTFTAIPDIPPIDAFLTNVDATPGVSVPIGTILSWGFDLLLVPAYQIGVPYSFQIPIVGGSGSYTLKNPTQIPLGLSMSSSGLISGTPINGALNNVLIQIVDSTCQNFQCLEFTLYFSWPPVTSVGPLIPSSTFDLYTFSPGYNMPGNGLLAINQFHPSNGTLFKVTFSTIVAGFSTGAGIFSLLKRVPDAIAQVTAYTFHSSVSISISSPNGISLGSISLSPSTIIPFGNLVGANPPPVGLWSLSSSGTLPDKSITTNIGVFIGMSQVNVTFTGNESLSVNGPSLVNWDPPPPTIGNGVAGTDYSITYPNVVGTGRTYVTYDFYVPVIGVSGKIFNDLNGSGIINVSDPGIPGLILTLMYGFDAFGADATPVIGVPTITTDAGGNYQFEWSVDTAGYYYSIHCSEVVGGTLTACDLGFENTQDGGITFQTTFLPYWPNPLPFIQTGANFGFHYP
jgi:hypothetical protein